MNAFVRPLLSTVLGCAVALPAVAQPPAEISPAEMLKRADTDGDGTVSRDEFVKSRTAMLEERFKQLDTNGDGQLDLAEAEAAAEQMRSMAAGGRGGFRRPEGQRPQRSEGPRSAGAEGERPQRPAGGPIGEQAFERLDRDGDGKLSREEFAEGMGRLREAMQRGGPGPAAPGRPEGGDRGPAEGFRRPPEQD